MAKTSTSRFVELLHYLQDPHHVARFQEICGVRGTFSRNSVEIRDTEETHLHNNGVCIHPNSESNKCTVNGGGEGEKTEGLRQRTATSTEHSLKHEGLENVLQNGAAVTATGCETFGHNTSCSSRGTTTVENVSNNVHGSEVESLPTPQILEHTVKEEDPGPSQSTVKPLRKNSLTGDLGQEFIIHNKFLYYLFTFGTELGNELFYITFFPFCIWNVDAYVCRRLVVIWVWVMYLGQSTKDVIRWSRPASPPVVKVEMFYNSEYSMPSTHAMSGTALPFSLFLLTYQRWEYPFMLGLTLALFWCILVCLSRIYMGMHSILDVIAGVLYSILILVVFQPALDLIDNFNQTCRYAPFIIITLHVGMGLFSFTLDTWSTSRGDTAQILGSGAGIALASHLNHRLGLMPDPPLSQLPLSFPDLTISLVAVTLLRLCLGVVFLLATRAVMKAVTVPLACCVFGVPSGDVRKARQHMEVELPYRYMVYGTVGFNTLFLVPLLFTYLHLS